MQVTVHDFRVTDRVLAETDPEAGDVVYLGPAGTTAAPFVVMRRLSGPGGTYIDGVEVVDADGRALVTKDTRFELDGESKPRTLWTEFRGTEFPAPGVYSIAYYVYDDQIASFPFTVVQQEAPGAGIVPGPLDAALSKSTIVWLSFSDELHQPDDYGHPIKQPHYLRGKEYSVWYGYQDGRIYVLVGEGEQQVPGLTTASKVGLIARSKDVQSRISAVDCSVAVLPKNATWDALARDLLVGRRLNLRDGDGAIDRWRSTCEIVQLTPLPPAVPAEA